MRRSLWPRKCPLWSPPTTTRCRRSPYSTERCIAVSTQMCTNNEIFAYHGGAQGRFLFLCVFVCARAGTSSTAELVAKLYEAAVKKVPLSEEYHSHLFMAYARVGEYKKMQQVRSAHTVASKQTATVSFGCCLAHGQHISSSGRQEWPCTKSSRRTRTTSGQS